MPRFRISMAAWIGLGVVALAAFALAPGLGTGYWGEDTYYSIIVRGGLVLNGDSISKALVDYQTHNFHMGRFYPLTPLIITSVFYGIADVFVYKSYLVAMTLLDLGLFLVLVRKVGGSVGFAGLAGCVVVGLFQFRVFIDPILAYYGQIQWMTAGVFASLLGLLMFLEGRGRGWLVVSIGAYLAACLTYEVAYTLVVVHLLLIAKSSRGGTSRVILASPFLGVVGFCGGMSFLMRRLYPGNLYLQSPRLDPAAVALALAKQTTSSLPLSYWFCDPLKVFERTRAFDGLMDLRVVGLGLIALGLSYLSLRQGKVRGINRVGLGLVMGLILAVLPAVLIAISPYHQNYLTFGVGWISVVTQYFGVGLVLATGLWSLVAMRPGGGSFARGKCLAASIMVAGVVGWTGRANLEVARCFNASPGTENFREFAGQHGAAWHEPRLNLESALDAGLMDEVPANSTVQVAHEYPYWHDPLYGPMFYAKHANKRLIIAGPAPGLPANPTYQVRDLYQGSTTGFVVLSVSAPEALSVKSRGLRLFVKGPDVFRLGALPNITVVDPATKVTLRPARDLPVIRSGRDWVLFSLASTTDRVDPTRLQVVDASTGLAWTASDSKGSVAERARTVTPR